MNLPVKLHLPTTVKCPLCNRERLQIYSTAEAGGRWYLCQHCRFRGDAIELYQAVYNLENLDEAVYDMAQSGILILDSKPVSRNTVASYRTTYVKFRNRFLDLVATSNKQLADLDAPTRRLLNEYSLWDGYKAGRWHEEIGRFMGVLTAKQLRAEGYKLPPGFHRMLVLPFYDVPGRISSLLLLGRKGRTRRITTRPACLDDDDGLMLSNWLDTTQPYVLALADPVMALRLQRKSFNALGRPSPIVVYGQNTTKAWQTIHASKVIFWNGDENYTMFSQAMLRVGSHVALRPNTDIDTSGYFDKLGIAALLSAFRGSTISWAEAMKRFILESNAWKVADYMHNLEIPEGLLKHVYDTCSPTERQLMKQIIRDVVPERFAYVGNLRIAEIDGQWYTIYRDHRELAADAILCIERAVNIKETNENRYEGVIQAAGKKISFNEKIGVVEKKTAIWMQGLMMQAGLPPPIIDPKIEKYLVTVARKFHPPEYIQKHGRVGWNQGLQSFIFPNFSIMEGRVDSTVQAATQGTSIPAGEVTGCGAAEGQWDVLVHEPDWAIVWAGLAGFMANMIAPILGASPQPLAFVGLPGSAGALVGEYLCRELGMLTAPVTKTKEPLLEVQKITGIHNYPVWFDPTAHNRRGVAYLKASEPVNALTLMTVSEAAALAVGDVWTFVDSQSYLTQRDRMPSMRGVFDYLGWLQRREFRLEAEATSLVRCVLESLKQWAIEELGAGDAAVFARASRLLHTFDMLSLDRRLLHLIFCLRQAQRIKLKEAKFYENFTKGESPPDVRAPHLFVDNEKKKVYLSMSALRTAVFQARLSVPDYDNALQSFSKSGTGFEISSSGFVVDQGYYDSERTRWLKMRQ